MRKKAEKTEYFEKKKKVIGQKIKVLVNTPIFQEQIIELRKKWKIPLNGIKEEDERLDWYGQLSAKTDEFHKKEWPKYRAEIAKLREAKKFREAEEKKDEYNLKVPLNAYRNDIWRIVRSFRLSSRWHFSIERYLLYNDPNNMGVPLGATLSTTWENGMKQLSILINGDTTLADIRKIWPTVKMMQEDLNDRQAEKFQPIPNFDRDKRAYELEQEGKTLNEIGEIINSEYDGGLLDGEIKQIIKRYKKRLNID